MSVVSAADEPTGAVPVDPVRDAEQRARDRLKAEDFRAAREIIQEALHVWRDRPELWWLLADVEFADGDQQAGSCCLAKAVRAGSQAAGAISKQIQSLTENNLWRETLITVEKIPARVRSDPRVRTSIGDFYETLKCHGHAVDAYGDNSGLQSSARKKRRGSWLRSGGPFTFMRRRLVGWEKSQLLSVLGRSERACAQLDAVPELDTRQAHRLKVQVDNRDYEWSYQVEFWTAVFCWLLRLLPVAFLPVWLVLYATVYAGGFISGPPGVVAGTAISAVIALGLAILGLRSQVRSDLTVRGILRLLSPSAALFVFLIAIAVLAEVAVAEAYDHGAFPTTAWWAWVIFGFAVLPAVCACMLVSAGILLVLSGWRMQSVPRKHCQIIMLEMFLYMLLDVQSPSCQLDLEWGLLWSRNLEWGARRISRNLLPSETLNYLASADWLRKRAAGWAEALRYMQREIVAPVPGGRPKLRTQLRHEIRCLATGDLGALAWRQPPPSPSRRTTLARKTIEILRTILVAALPLGAVLVSQAVLHFSNEVFRWASIATGVWALLYVIISLDPAIRDKIDTARSLAETIHEVRRSGG